MKPRSSRPWSSSPDKAESPSEIACKPAASGAMSGPRGVGAAHDQRQARKRRLALKPKQLEHGVEAAAFAVVRDFDVGNIERDAAEFGGRLLHIGWINKYDFGACVEEAPDQPRAGDAIDFRPSPGHPDARPAWCKTRERHPVNQWQPGLAPRCKAALKHARAKARLAQFGGDELAELLAGLASDDNWALPIERRTPAREFGWVLPRRGWQLARPRVRRYRACTRRRAAARVPCQSGARDRSVKSNSSETA